MQEQIDVRKIRLIDNGYWNGGTFTEVGGQIINIITGAQIIEQSLANSVPEDIIQEMRPVMYIYINLYYIFI